MKINNNIYNIQTMNIFEFRDICEIIFNHIDFVDIVHFRAINKTTYGLFNDLSSTCDKHNKVNCRLLDKCIDTAYGSGNFDSQNIRRFYNPRIASTLYMINMSKTQSNDGCCAYHTQYYTKKNYNDGLQILILNNISNMKVSESFFPNLKILYLINSNVEIKINHTIQIIQQFNN